MLKPFESPTHAKRTYRELKLLTYLNHPDAAVCIKLLYRALQDVLYF